MNNCIVCKEKIPPNRKRYCSKKCIKVAWYVKNNPKAKSHHIKNSDFFSSNTGIGYKWEKYVAKILGAEHREFCRGVDLIWNGKTIDVKTSSLFKRRFKRGKPVVKEQSGVWSFKFSHNRVIPDYFFLVCINKSSVEKMYLIPSCELGKRGVVIGWKSIYDKYIYKPASA